MGAAADTEVMPVHVDTTPGTRTVRSSSRDIDLVTARVAGDPYPARLNRCLRRTSRRESRLPQAGHAPPLPPYVRPSRQDTHRDPELLHQLPPQTPLLGAPDQRRVLLQALVTTSVTQRGMVKLILADPVEPFLPAAS